MEALTAAFLMGAYSVWKQGKKNKELESRLKLSEESNQKIIRAITKQDGKIWTYTDDNGCVFLGEIKNGLRVILSSFGTDMKEGSLRNDHETKSFEKSWTEGFNFDGKVFGELNIE